MSSLHIQKLSIVLIMTDADLGSNQPGVIRTSYPSATVVFKKFKALGLGTGTGTGTGEELPTRFTLFSNFFK